MPEMPHPRSDSTGGPSFPEGCIIWPIVIVAFFIHPILGVVALIGAIIFITH